MISDAWECASLREMVFEEDCAPDIVKHLGGFYVQPNEIVWIWALLRLVYVMDLRDIKRSELGRRCDRARFGCGAPNDSYGVRTIIYYSNETHSSDFLNPKTFAFYITATKYQAGYIFPSQVNSSDTANTAFEEPEDLKTHGGI